MENILLLLGLLLTTLLITRRSEIERFSSSSFAIGLTLATVAALIGMPKFASSSTIVWVAIYQLSWVIYQNLRLGTRGEELWNSCIFFLAASVLMVGRFIVNVSSISGFVSLIAVLLLIRWFGLPTPRSAGTTAVKDLSTRQERRKLALAHGALLKLSRQLESANRFLISKILPHTSKPSVRALICLINLAIAATTFSYFSGSLVVVPACNLALARDQAGNFSDQLYAPGLKAVTPFLKQLVVVSICPFKLPESGTIEMIARTADQLKVSVSLSAKVKLRKDRTSIVRLFQGSYRGEQRPAAESQLRLCFADFVHKKKLRNFIPLFGENRQQLELEFLAFASAKQKSIFEIQSVHIEEIGPAL